jgi:hypothetical protein
MIMSYEKMSKDIAGVLRDTLRFMGNWPIDDMRILKSVRRRVLKICAP